MSVSACVRTNQKKDKSPSNTFNKSSDPQITKTFKTDQIANQRAVTSEHSSPESRTETTLCMDEEQREKIMDNDDSFGKTKQLNDTQTPYKNKSNENHKIYDEKYVSKLKR